MAVLCSKTAFALDRRFREAQNPETFQVAPFNFPDQVHETVSHEKPEKRVFVCQNIAKECGKLAIIWKNPDSFEIVPKIGNHLENPDSLETFRKIKNNLVILLEICQTIWTRSNFSGSNNAFMLSSFFLPLTLSPLSCV